MNLLLDTNMLIWALVRPEFLPGKAKRLIDDAETTPYFSPVSIWEVTIKYGRERQDFDVDPRVLRGQLVCDGYLELPITGLHALAVGDLPSIHKDPFDRLLLAQAKADGLTLLTADETMSKYPVPLLYFPKRQRK